MSVRTGPVPLESGDHLGREEFHRRYCLRPDIKKAELIGGVVYVPSPARYGVHGQQQGWVIEWLSTYARGRLGVRYAFDVTVYLAADSEVQPEAILFLVPPPGAGGAILRADHYIEGPPQLVVEVAASSVSIDMHRKLGAYEQAGVQEYVIWRVYDGAIDWFRLRDGTYERVQPDEHGVIASATFPGLRLHVARLLAGDIKAVLAELDSPQGA